MKTKSGTGLLLSTIMRATSRLNVLKYTTDKKKKKQAIGNIIGVIILWVILMGYSIAYACGLVMFGMGEELPAFTALVVWIISFFITLLKAGGYLFGFKDYDMLMSMPFSVKDVVGSKFLHMYESSLLWTASLPLAMLTGYGLSGNLTVMRLVMWLVMIPFLPVIPMILASAIGIFITFLASRSRHRTMIRTVLTLVITIPLMFSGSIISGYAEAGADALMIGRVAGLIDRAADYMPGAGFFVNSIKNQSLSDCLLLAGISITVYELFFIIVSRYYRQISSRLSEVNVRRENKTFDYRQRKMPAAIMIKEWKRMTGSTIYTTNVVMSVVLVLIMGVGIFFVSPYEIMYEFFNGAPVSMDIIIPAIPFIVHFILGLVSTTAISPSVEGKNYWIIKSLPVSERDDCRGKVYFNLSLMLPAGIFAVTTISIRFGAGINVTILNVLLITALTHLSTYYGLFCGLRHRRLDWTNEAEVVKQGTALLLYMFPNMLITVVLTAATIFLGVKMNPVIVQICMIPVIMIIGHLFWVKSAIRV